MKSNNLILRLLLVFMALTGSLYANADVGVVVWNTSGTRDVFLLADKPVISYPSDSLHMVTAKAEVKYPLAQVQQLTFEDAATGINAVEAARNAGMTAKVSDNSVELWNLDAKAVVNVYLTSGQSLGQYRADNNGHIMVDLSSQPKGILIVKAGKSTIKIIRK